MLVGDVMVMVTVMVMMRLGRARARALKMAVLGTSGALSGILWFKRGHGSSTV